LVVCYRNNNNNNNNNLIKQFSKIIIIFFDQRRVGGDEQGKKRHRRCRAIVSRGFQQAKLLSHYHIVQQSFFASMVYCTAINVIF